MLQRQPNRLDNRHTVTAFAVDVETMFAGIIEIIPVHIPFLFMEFPICLIHGAGRFIFQILFFHKPPSTKQEDINDIG